MKKIASAETEESNENLKLINSLIRKYSKSGDYLPVENTSIHVQTTQTNYKLIRLNDEQYSLLRQNSVPITEDYLHAMSLEMNRKCIFSSLAKMYIALKMCFGESGNYYDDWKGAFSFPFLIYFEKDGQSIAYIMNVFNLRASIDFSVAKLIHEDDDSLDRTVLHDPFEEFPRREINYVIDFLVGYLTGFFQSAKDRYDEPFFKSVRSDLILFGYKDGSFFDQQFEDSDGFDEAVQNMCGELGCC
jgi:hypothetical protein